MVDQENIAHCVFHDDRHDDCVQHSGQAPCMTQSESDLFAKIDQLTRERDEARADDRQAMTYLQQTRDALGHKGDFPSLIEEAKALKSLLGNLLAVIHRDGGHYQDKHGTTKAVEDAINRVIELNHTHELARKFARTKGRFHAQQAMCDLLESFHMPCVRPTKERPQQPAYHEPTCDDLKGLAP